MKVFYRFNVMYGDSSGYDNGCMTASDEPTIKFLDALFEACCGNWDDKFMSNYHRPELVKPEESTKFVELTNKLAELYNDYLVSKDEDAVDLATDADSAADIVRDMIEVISDSSGVSFYSEYTGDGLITSYFRKELGETGLVLTVEEAEKKLSELIGVEVAIGYNEY